MCSCNTKIILTKLGSLTSGRNLILDHVGLHTSKLINALLLSRVPNHWCIIFVQQSMHLLLWLCFLFCFDSPNCLCKNCLLMLIEGHLIWCFQHRKLLRCSTSEIGSHGRLYNHFSASNLWWDLVKVNSTFSQCWLPILTFLDFSICLHNSYTCE